MIVARRYQLPDDKRDVLRRAVRLEWITIFFLITITIVMYLAMGSSQAMKTAWVEDVLSLIPPILFLISVHVKSKPPSKRFPYGLHAFGTASFAGSALALLLLGLFLLYEAVMALARAEHPTVGSIELFGRSFWMGWVMIAALIYSVMPPVILGRIKIRLARELHDKTLFTDAETNKADWMTAVAAIFGILGIGLGWWWADSAAAGIIALDIVRDGGTQLKDCVADICHQRPTSVEQEPETELLDRVAEAMGSLEWVEDADVRLRDAGNLVTGEVFVVPSNHEDLPARVGAARTRIIELDWRLHDVTVQPVEQLDRADPRGASD